MARLALLLPCFQNTDLIFLGGAGGPYPSPAAAAQTLSRKKAGPIPASQRTMMQFGSEWPGIVIRASARPLTLTHADLA